MDRHLLTHSLHDSVRWFVKLDSKPIEELYATLRRERGEPTEAMTRGIVFEHDVLDCCNGIFAPDPENENYSRCVIEAAEYCRGGMWDVRLSKDIEIAGRPFFLYGRADNIRRDWINDLKYSGSYEVGKYTPSIQHLIYMFNSGIEKFRYIIADGHTVCTEEYFWSDDSEETLFRELTNLVSFIDTTPQLTELYYQNWKSKQTKGEENAVSA